MPHEDLTPDEQLLAAFLERRDDATFEALVVRHGPMVLRVCRDLLGDLADAEDAFQAIFLTLFRRAGSIRDRRAVGRWLHEVACRVANRGRAVRARRREQERLALAMKEAPRPDQEVDDREWRPILHEEIRQLPPKLRDVIVLCHLEGLSVEAAALQLDCPSGTLKSRLVKGRDVLRGRLTRRGLAATAVLLLLAGEAPARDGAVPEHLVRSTVAATAGDPAKLPGRIADLARDDGPSLRRLRRLLVAALVVGLTTVAGARWAPAAWPGPIDPIRREIQAEWASLWSLLLHAGRGPAEPRGCH